MAHNNSTPASVLTAPISLPRHLVGQEAKLIRQQVVTEAGVETKLTTTPVNNTREYELHPLSGQITNPKKQAEKNRKNAARRVRKAQHAKRSHKA